MAVGLLARRARGRTELDRKLQERGYPADQIAAALERLAASGALDDTELAAQVARQRLRSGQGQRRVTQDLRRRGVAAEEARQGWERAGGAEAEAAALDVMARRLWAAKAKQEPVERARKTAAALMRRGYAPGAVTAAVRRLSRPAADEAFEGIDTDALHEDDE